MARIDLFGEMSIVVDVKGLTCYSLLFGSLD